ncbi:MAG: alpha/beta fold hydrolase, partial [Omnitrophica WOR_2 bacterium]
YTTEASAADIEDLRAALGIDQWNIVSAGYGSRLAAILMRDHPQSIRSVVMDSPLPPQGNLYLDQAMSAQQALAEFFKSCTSDPACNQAYPDLENNFYNLVYALNASPLSVPVSDLSAGKRYDILLDGDRLLDITLNAIRSERMQVLSVLPRIVFQLQNGKTQQVAETLGSMTNSLIQAAAGLNLLVSCRDQFNQATPDQIQQANSQAAPQLGDYFNHQLEYLQAACEIWKTNAPAEKMAPVLSSIPVLVLSGSYGWSMPPAWAKQVAGGLSRSTLVEFAGGGQTVTTSQRWSDCAGKIVSAFLSDPQARPDTGCTQEKKPVEWITVP